jgi:outer membrane protein TolC
MYLIVTGTAWAAAAGAQTAPDVAALPQPLALDEAINYAVQHYPTVRAALEQVNASAANVDIARGAYRPRLDSLWQSNRATANNVFGQLLPQPVIPAMSGPVLPSASSQSVWSSAVGALFSWEPFDFGLRHAGVTSAEASLDRARAGENLTRLEVARAVASAYLDLVSAQRGVAAAQADFDRRDVLRRAVQTLVDNQLRPGAEASRANAERAASQTRLIQSQQLVTLAQTTLMRLLGVARGPLVIAADRLVSSTPAGELAADPAAVHPLARVHRAAIDQARARETELARSDLPRVYLQSSVFARGSGANADGALDGSVDGLALDRANWAAGIQVVMPNLFDFSTLRARRAAAAASTRAESALYDESLLEITEQQQAAAAVLQAARAIAANTPIELAAAQESEGPARARYNAGLASILEVADAQSLLAQAEVDDQVARVNVWRALLATAMAHGDLAPFVALLRQP